MKGNLFLIPTYLSESNDRQFISPVVTDILQNVNQFIVENVRTARRFISSLNLGIDISSLQFEVIDKNSTMSDIHRIMGHFTGDIGLISEAGLPCLADPGNLAVAYAHTHGIQVVPLPGASAIQTAVICSGFNGQQFVFHGYVPIDNNERMAFIKKMESDLLKTGYTQVFMETPYRNRQLMEVLTLSLSPSTKLSVAADISGKKELIRTLTIADWKSYPLDIHKLPAVFSLGQFPG